MFAKPTLTSSSVSCWHSRHFAVLQKLVGNQGIANSGKPTAGPIYGFMPKIVI
jgi:hypothetical protein